MTPQTSSDLVQRLLAILEDYQLKEFVEVLEAVQDAGRGYGRVELTMTNHAITDIAGNFTRKPRKDQGSWLQAEQRLADRQAEQRRRST